MAGPLENGPRRSRADRPGAAGLVVGSGGWGGLGPDPDFSEREGRLCRKPGRPALLGSEGRCDTGKYEEGEKRQAGYAARALRRGAVSGPGSSVWPGYRGTQIKAARPADPLRTERRAAHQPQRALGRVRTAWRSWARASSRNSSGGARGEAWTEPGRDRPAGPVQVRPEFAKLGAVAQEHNRDIQ